MQQEKLGPLHNAHAAITRVQACAPERRFGQPANMIVDDKPLGRQIVLQFFQRAKRAGRESGIIVGHIAFKGRLVLLFHLPYAVQEDGLVRSEVRYLLEDAPFAGVDSLFQLFFVKTFDKLVHRFMLVSEPGEYRCR